MAGDPAAVGRSQDRSCGALLTSACVSPGRITPALSPRVFPPARPQMDSPCGVDRQVIPAALRFRRYTRVIALRSVPATIGPSLPDELWMRILLQVLRVLPRFRIR